MVVREALIEKRCLGNDLERVRNKHAYLNEENSRESRGMEVGM
jgi:hypothetical protein